VRAKTYFTGCKSNRVASACKLRPSDGREARRPPRKTRPSLHRRPALLALVRATSLRASASIEGRTFTVCGNQSKSGSSRGRNKQGRRDATQLGSVQPKRTFEFQGLCRTGNAPGATAQNQPSNSTRAVYAVSNNERFFSGEGRTLFARKVILKDCAYCAQLLDEAGPAGPGCPSRREKPGSANGIAPDHAGKLRGLRQTATA
jgi:hypothetical protein